MTIEKLFSDEIENQVNQLLAIEDELLRNRKSWILSVNLAYQVCSACGGQNFIELQEWFFSHLAEKCR